MTNVTWSFDNAVRWLREKSGTLEESGVIVELEVHDTGRGSARLRVERGWRLGELTVWSDGIAHMAVLDLPSGDFILERDGVPLTEAPFEAAFKDFFDEVERKAPG